MPTSLAYFHPASPRLATLRQSLRGGGRLDRNCQCWSVGWGYPATLRREGWLILNNFGEVICWVWAYLIDMKTRKVRLAKEERAECGSQAKPAILHQESGCVMKTFTKIGSLFVAGALVVSLTPDLSRAGDAGVKRGGLEYKGPEVSLFATSKTEVKPAITCAMCKPEFVAAVTQDTKLKTKTVVLEQHACKACATTFRRVGAQKATGKDVAQHSCAGRLVAAVEACCTGMPGRK
jgi:hypothetical protein